ELARRVHPLPLPQPAADAPSTPRADLRSAARVTHIQLERPITERTERARSHSHMKKGIAWRSGGQRTQRSERRPQVEGGGGGIPSERVPQWSPSRPHLASDALQGGPEDLSERARVCPLP